MYIFLLFYIVNIIILIIL